VPDGRYYVFAAAFPRSDHPLSYLMPDYTTLRVGAAHGPLTVQRGCVDGQPDILLRSVNVTDPPILSPLSLFVRLEQKAALLSSPAK
jgi:hypothetical protein